MAENIIGILFVTSSSSGRNIFRYPPDPTSTVERLSQPIYPSATYTARDTTVDVPSRKRLFGSQLDARSRTSSGQDRRKSSNNSAKSSGIKLRKPWGEGSSDAGSRSKGLGVSPNNANDASDEYEEEEDDSSSSGDSDYDGLYSGALGKLSEDEDDPKSAKKGDDRRGSLAETEKRTDTKPEKDKFIESQYLNCIGYSADFLADMLTPPRAACNRKFEISVDELVFIGHPVVVGESGQWGLPDEDDEDKRATRGRRREPAGGLGTVDEVASAPNSPKEVTTKKSDDGPPLLNMFHLVLIMDKPDPDPSAPVEDARLFDEVYWDIAYKWTAAALHLQIRENWVGRLAYENAKFKEQCMNDGIPIMRCLHMAIERNPLARSLNQLYNAIHQLQTTPINPLLSHLPTKLTVNVADIPVNIVISPKPTDADEAWAQWGDANDRSSSESDDSDAFSDRVVTRTKAENLKVEPWQTLLMIDNRAPGKVSADVMGLGIDGDICKIPEEPRDTASEEDDERKLLRDLIEELTVTKPLADIAHALRCDLDAIIIPLAKELVQNKRAILIEVITLRLRSIIMPTTIAEHTSTLTQYTMEFQKAFPSLPLLPSFIGMISQSPVPYAKHLPPHPSESVRQLWMNALVWLLKNDLVVQIHTRTRIFASPQVKDQAWRNLWHRRRKRWIENRSKPSPAETPQVNALELITPRAGDVVNPMDASIPGLQGHLYPLNNSYLGFDPDLEMDSDLGEGDDDSRTRMEFSIDVEEPQNVPDFTASFIFKPAKAQKDEARWIRVIRETGDEVSASKFDLCVQYLDGVTTFEEISYRTGLHRRELERILGLYKEHLVTFLHP